jgi:hypothetical protein
LRRIIGLLINTRLQPGVALAARPEPFQRFHPASKTVETVFDFDGFTFTPLKQGVNENSF